MIASWTESAGVLLSILTPLVAVPLTAITFYLRSLREQQASARDEHIRRVESMERSVVDLRHDIAEFERDYTTKEEWLRECMLARRTLEQLRETTIRLETTLQGTTPAPPQPVRPEPAESVRPLESRGRTGSPDRRDEGNQ